MSIITRFEGDFKAMEGPEWPLSVSIPFPLCLFLIESRVTSPRVA
jgi:hypothetical protein